MDTFGELTREEESLVGQLTRDLNLYRPKNAEKWRYYDGEASLKNIGLAIPEAMVNIDAVIGWGGIIVDALDERLDWQGWVSDTEDISRLSAVFRQNQLGTEFDKAKLDAFVTGVGFFEVTAGGEGEPDVVVNAVSSNDGVYIWDGRRSRVAAGLVSKVDPATGDDLITIYLPDSTITMVRGRERLSVHRVVHNRGRCGLVAFPNKSRAGGVRGKSELTRPIRYTIDHGVRTILGMEYNREIYTTPQRYFANVEPEDLGIDEDMDADERVRAGWNVSMTRAVILPPQEGTATSNGPTPTTGQYESAPPTPYIDELKMCTQLISAYSGVPAQQLGFVTANPPSAESVRAMESRHVKMAERRSTSFSYPLVNDVAFIAQSILHERYPDEEPAPTPEFLASVSAKWGNPATPTVAAATDSTVKLVEKDILPAHSSVALERAGFSESEIRRIEQDRRRAATDELLTMARQRAAGGGQLDPTVGRLAAASGED
ncbi:phage portal protein [Corynebacterium sanguinis]|uniref:Phage portal protein n=1 Tax=Corynebacterium sanguinis TaxID=2594913 RepID=A0A6C1U1B5_9CORY|nr:phage portal protein [Corynebacterium sanguinis]TVS29806.1 phage portal protein [Corynebacterium sanguinis]